MFNRDIKTLKNSSSEEYEMVKQKECVEFKESVIKYALENLTYTEQNQLLQELKVAFFADRKACLDNLNKEAEVVKEHIDQLAKQFL